MSSIAILNYYRELELYRQGFGRVQPYDDPPRRRNFVIAPVCCIDCRKAYAGLGSLHRHITTQH